MKTFEPVMAVINVSIKFVFMFAHLLFWIVAMPNWAVLVIEDCYLC